MKGNLIWGTNLTPLAYHRSLQNWPYPREGFQCQKGCEVLGKSSNTRLSPGLNTLANHPWAPVPRSTEVGVEVE